jgi:hypothetical protein
MYSGQDRVGLENFRLSAREMSILNPLASAKLARANKLLAEGNKTPSKKPPHITVRPVQEE